MARVHDPEIMSVLTSRQSSVQALTSLRAMYRVCLRVSVAPSNPFTSCVGEATLTGVGGNQAKAPGALYSQYPAQTGGSIRGGVFGTVAVQRGFLGLSTKQLRQYGTQITILPIFNQEQIAQLGGPTGALSVSDYGDPGIQATSGVAFDIYRFPTVPAGMQFGRQPNQFVGITFPTASGGSCPSGFVQVP